MATLRAAFGAHQVVPALDVIQVRAFDPDRLLRELHAAVHDHLARAGELAGLRVELLNPDGAVAVVERRAFRRTVVDDIGPAVVIEEERRIDAVDLLEPHRLGPGAAWIAR